MADDNETSGTPRFAHALLGYDRYQVEEYLGRLHEWALEAQDRAADLERQLELRDEEIRALKVLVHGGPGAGAGHEPADQAGAIIVNSLDELVKLRRAAAEEAERAIESARAQALEVVRNARELAEQIVGQARDERDQARREAERLRAEAQNGRTGTGTGTDGPSDLSRIVSRLRRLNEDLHDLSVHYGDSSAPEVPVGAAESL